MKHIKILLGGTADRPIVLPDGKTPLESADTPCLDRMLKNKNTQTGLTDCTKSFGANLALLSLLNYRAVNENLGRASFEAAYFDIPLDSEDVALCCKFVTLSDEEEFEEKTLLSVLNDNDIDIDDDEARQIISYLAENLNNEIFRLYYGNGANHILVWKKGEPNPGTLTVPYIAQGRNIAEFVPDGEFTAPLYHLMKKSYDLLSNHEINTERLFGGKTPVNGIWLYSQGTKALVTSRQNGVIIADSAFACGAGKAAGLTVVHTDFEHLAQAAVSEIAKTFDNDKEETVFIHTDIAEKFGLSGDFKAKTECIGMLDKQLTEPILNCLGGITKQWDLSVQSDCCISSSLRNYCNDPVRYYFIKSRNEG